MSRAVKEHAWDIIHALAGYAFDSSGYRCAETSECKSRSATFVSIVFLIAVSRCEHSVARWTIAERLHPAAVRECSSQVASGRRTETLRILNSSSMPPALFSDCSSTWYRMLRAKIGSRSSGRFGIASSTQFRIVFGKRSIADPESELDQT